MSKNNYPIYPGWTTIREIGRGSYGGVYEIERKIGGAIEKAALKHISIPQNEGEIRSMRQMGMDDASVTNMFEEQKESVLKEYLLVRNLGGHTNVVNCDDVSEIQHSDGMGWDIYIRMELLTALTDHIKSYPGENETIQMGVDLCNALVLCEKNKIIHRDIKPQNIFVSPNGDYKLGDFGIAHTIESATHGASTVGIGTNNYMAPEVKYGNEKYNHTVDIYSFGLVMYWLMNEMRLPFCPLPPTPMRLSDMQNAQARRMNGEALPAPKHGSAALKAVVLKACAFDPKARYQSAAEMKQALEALGKAEEKPVENVPMIDMLAEDDATMGAWTPVVKTPPVIEIVPVTEPVVEDEPGLDDEDTVIPTKNEDKTVGMWAASVITRELKSKVEETPNSQPEEPEENCSEEIANEQESYQPADEQSNCDEQAAEVDASKAQKKLAEAKKKVEEAKKKKLAMIAVTAAVVVLLIVLLFPKGQSDGGHEDYVSNPTEPTYTHPPVTSTPAPTAATVEDNRVVPDKELFDLWCEDISYSVIAPKQASYLSEIQYGVIQAPKEVSVYGFAGPSYTSSQLKRPIKHGDEVEIIAKQKDFYLIRVTTKNRVAWVSCELISVNE